MSSASPWGRSIGERTSNSGGSVVSAALELGESVSLSVSVALVGSVVALSLSRGATTEPTSATETDSETDRKSTRLNSSHVAISYAVFCLKKKKQHSKRHIQWYTLH